MGYHTDFAGELKFVNELTASQLFKIESFLGEDCRDHPEWEDSFDLHFVDLEFTDGFTGLQWNGAEKTYDLVEIVNMLIINICKEFPNFSLIGELRAEGEERNDNWKLIIGSDGMAHKKQ
jgi:hypothetical protein